MKGRPLVAIAGLALAACGVAQVPNATSTPSSTSSVAVTATPSFTPAPTPTPMPTPLPTPTPTRAPTPTLNPTAANYLSQITDLASTMAVEQTLVRSRCAYLTTPELASECEFIVNQAGGYAQGIPQALQGFVDNYNLAANLTSAIDNLQLDLRSLNNAISAELSGIQALSSTDVLSASSEVESDAYAISDAARTIRDLLP